jgi:hypothetical protein
MDASRTPGECARSRRAVLGAFGVGLSAAVAGCTHDDGNATPSADRETELVSGTLRVPPGSHGSRGFSLPDERWLTVGASLSDRSVDVKRDGPAVDVFVVRPDAAARYRRGEQFEYVEGVSMPDVVNGEVSATVGAGEYELLVDNTERGAGEPDGSGVDAVVDVEVVASTERGVGNDGVRPGDPTG